MKADLIIANIGQLVTCASPEGPKRGAAMRDVGIIENGAVVVSNGRIAAIGRSDEITGEFLANELIDAGGRVVCPGLVDPHTHIVYAGNRLDEFEMKIQGADYLRILESGGGILSTVRATRIASFEELFETGKNRLAKMLACGTTTCEIKTGYGLDLDTEMKMLRVVEELDKSQPIDVVPTFLGAHTIPAEFRENANGYVDLICETMLPAVRKWYERSHFSVEQRPFFCDVFSEKNAFDIEQSRRILNTANDLGFGIKAHVDQFTNIGATRMAIGLNAASVDHLDQITDEEIALLAARKTVGIVIPTENFNAAKNQFAPARRMIDAGCPVALSTDYNPGSAPCPSMPMAMAIAARFQKILPSEALNASTINSAHGIGMGRSYGSIEIGKIADLVVFDCTDYRDVAYEFGDSKVDIVVKKGVRVFPQIQ